ncbi:hypothetical protein [Anatilimnocola floriformis]|uniref:hypothetical protein n=1 Tax=Anatilimnocola floriformis TaxID=2948575 RepID=UPI0020C35F5B|nr:hypothetical protein [Anatilimnocola floriformis]
MTPEEIHKQLDLDLIADGEITDLREIRHWLAAAHVAYEEISTVAHRLYLRRVEVEAHVLGYELPGSHRLVMRSAQLSIEAVDEDEGGDH